MLSYLVVTVVGVADDGEDVADGAEDGGQPGEPQRQLDLPTQYVV